LPGTNARLFDALVNGDTCAQDWGDTVEWDILGDSGNVIGLCNAVLLESAVNSVSRHGSLGTQRLIRLLAKVTRKTRAVDPL
jgi:hypothetical protein